jgi:transcription elongation factor Elf1
MNALLKTHPNLYFECSFCRKLNTLFWESETDESPAQKVVVVCRHCGRAAEHELEEQSYR